MTIIENNWKDICIVDCWYIHLSNQWATIRSSAAKYLTSFALTSSDFKNSSLMVWDALRRCPGSSGSVPPSSSIRSSGPADTTKLARHCCRSRKDLAGIQRDACFSCRLLGASACGNLWSCACLCWNGTKEKWSFNIAVALYQSLRELPPSEPAQISQVIRLHWILQVWGKCLLPLPVDMRFNTECLRSVTTRDAKILPKSIQSFLQSLSLSNELTWQSLYNVVNLVNNHTTAYKTSVTREILGPYLFKLMDSKGWWCLDPAKPCARKLPEGHNLSSKSMVRLQDLGQWWPMITHMHGISQGLRSHINKFQTRIHVQYIYIYNIITWFWSIIYMIHAWPVFQKSLKTPVENKHLKE